MAIMVVMAMIRVAITTSGDRVLPPWSQRSRFMVEYYSLLMEEIQRSPVEVGSFYIPGAGFLQSSVFLLSLASLEEIIIPFLPKQSRVSLRYLYL